MLNCTAMADLERARRFVLRHGRATSAFQSLKPEFSFAFDEELESCVAYVDTGAAWVAAGPPLAEPERAPLCLERFSRRARDAGRRVCFLGLEREQAGRLGMGALRLGDEPYWQLADWERTLARHRGLESQLRRAARHGVRVRAASSLELTPGSATRRALEALVDDWLARRPLPPLGFLARVRPFDFLNDRLVTLAEHEGRIVAFASLVPVPARRGFLLENLVRAGCPNGTSELLIARSFEEARGRGADFVSLGLAPLREPDEPLLEWLRRLGRPLYRFDGLQAFRERLHPSHWEEYLLAHPQEITRLTALYDVLSAFVGGWRRFGLDAWRHRAHLS